MQIAPPRPQPMTAPAVAAAVAAPTQRESDAPHDSAYMHYLQAAQADPVGVLQMDPTAAANPSDVAALAAESWQLMSADARDAYEQTAQLAPTRAPRKRNATSISDDEAEYNLQCAQPAGSEAGLPPLRVDVGTTRMESIAVTNWRSGRASSRTFELERVRARQIKKRREEAQAEPETRVKESSTPGPKEECTPQFGENRFAVQTRIVDGKIVLDEQSLFASYRDDEQQEREQQHWEVVDERESDQFVNSASRSKQRRTQRWSAEETERFYQAVSQWGTDFEMITRLFPRRTRREIKSKWTKESRQNPKRLDDAFMRRSAVDLRAYGAAAGVDLSGPPPVITPRDTKQEAASQISSANPADAEEVGEISDV